jgi:translation initiation factor IF-2
MTDTNEQPPKKVLSLSKGGKLELKRPPGADAGAAGKVRQSFSHGRSKTVTVEVKRKRGEAPPAATPTTQAAAPEPAVAASPARTLSKDELALRTRVLREAIHEQEKAPPRAAETEAAADVAAPAPTAEAPSTPPPRILTQRERELEELRKIEEEERRAREERERLRAEEQARKKADEDARSRAAEQVKRVADRAGAAAAAKVAGLGIALDPLVEEDEDRPRRRGPGGAAPAKVAPSKLAPTVKRGGEADRRRGKMTVTQALNDEEQGERMRSLASVRRARERERKKLAGPAEQVKVSREVTVPDTITVQELANRMAERSSDVIKALMRMDVMATLNTSIDAETAELLVGEFGHKMKRVSESDVELGIDTAQDRDDDLLPRPPVVTVMGHVDHGKTSLLDAIRQTDVAAGEAGGITQHIGAYQVQTRAGNRITFIDTPGHAAFTAMRARGANVTDVVILVVAADDGIMPQTIEAISHAKAAGVPIIVAINKIDLPSANSNRVKQELLQHEIVVEDMGGETLAIEVSAKTKQGLDNLEQAIQLQAEILELKANPNRLAQGTVIEAKMEKGRGSVATVLVQRGTLKVGDVFVAGVEWGRVRALIDDRGQNLQSAGPAAPVEVLGLSGTPQAGDAFAVVASEAEAREIAEFRLRRIRQKQALGDRASMEQMFSQIREGSRKEVGLVVKADVHGSAEAIAGALTKIAADDTGVAVKLLSTGVGAITESDVTLANASHGIVIGFNVRANAQAREMAKRDGVEIRYYSIIYDVLDDIKAVLSGMMAPTLHEQFLGNAEIRQVFNMSKFGNVAGCMVTEGMVKRGAKVRLLRDNVVIHEGTLKTLKRFKDEVREVREGFECGMAFENYEDIKAGDVIECFEMLEVARSL